MVLFDPLSGYLLYIHRIIRHCVEIWVSVMHSYQNSYLALWISRISVTESLIGMNKFIHFVSEVLSQDFGHCKSLDKSRNSTYFARSLLEMSKYTISTVVAYPIP